MTLTQSISRPTSSAPFEERESRWRAAVHDRLTEMDLRLTRRSQMTSSVAARDLGDLLITDWGCPAVEGVRTPAMARKGADALLVLTASAGRQIIETPRQTLLLRPGAMLIMGTRGTGRFRIPETLTKRTVRVPMTALAPYDTGRGAPECLVVDTVRNPLARLTREFLNGTVADSDRMTPAERETARNALLVLIAGMMRATHAPDLGETDFLPFLRRRLEAWIVDRLPHGAIKVADLAAAHSVSPRTVHRAFAATGDTVGSVVRAHRLAAARTDLVHTGASIAAIAHRWGFCDASHFGREFRREFSMSAGDYRDAHGID